MPLFKLVQKYQNVKNVRKINVKNISLGKFYNKITNNYEIYNESCKFLQVILFFGLYYKIRQSINNFQIKNKWYSTYLAKEPHSVEDNPLLTSQIISKLRQKLL